jgi:Fe-S-cluster containining protein
MDTFDLPMLPPSGAPTCEGCPAHCCRYISVEIDRPDTKWQYDQIRWMLVHQNISVYVDHDGDWFVEFKTRCRELGEDNLCRSYERRPDLCRKYEAEECPVWNPGSPHKHEFKTEAEFTAWLDSKGRDWRYRAHEVRPEPRERRISQGDQA